MRQPSPVSDIEVKSAFLVCRTAGYSWLSAGASRVPPQSVVETVSYARPLAGELPRAGVLRGGADGLQWRPRKWGPGQLHVVVCRDGAVSGAGPPARRNQRGGERHRGPAG